MQAALFERAGGLFRVRPWPELRAAMALRECVFHSVGFPLAEVFLSICMLLVCCILTLTSQISLTN